MCVKLAPFPCRHGRHLLVLTALVAPTLHQGPAVVQRVHLEAAPIGLDPRHAQFVALVHMPYHLLGNASNVPLVPTQTPSQRRLSALVYHARRDPTPLRQVQHRQIRAQSAHQALTSRTQGLAAPQAAYHAQLAPIMALQELYLKAIAVSVQRAHTLHPRPLSVPPALLALGRLQTPPIAPIAQPALTTVHTDPRA